MEFGYSILSTIILFWDSGREVRKLKRRIWIALIFIIICLCTSAYAIKLDERNETVRDPFILSSGPEMLELIEESAFENTALEVVKLPESVRKIQDYAFAGSTSLRILQLPSNIEDIGDKIIQGSTHAMVAAAENSNVKKWAQINRVPFSAVLFLDSIKGHKVTTIFVSSSDTKVDLEASGFNRTKSYQKTRRTGRTLGELKSSHFKGIAAQHVQSRFFP